jgi:DNA repair protein RadC
MATDDAGHQFALPFSQSDRSVAVCDTAEPVVMDQWHELVPTPAATLPVVVFVPPRRGTIKDWPRADRPRDKLLDHGPGVLSDAELLAIILGSGSAGQSALDQGRAIMHRFPDFRHLATAGVGDLCATPGLGLAKAAQLLAAIEIAKRYGEKEFQPGQPLRGSGDVYAHFRERLAAEQREVFCAVLLDNKHRKLKDIVLSLGSLTASIVHPRDVFAPVVREAAAAVVFVHNHPSGDPTPSREDIEITRRLREVGDIMGVRVLDHIVIGKGRYVSFVDDGYW